MQTKPNAMTWMEQQTPGLPERGVTELALRILNQIEAEMNRQGVSRTESETSGTQAFPIRLPSANALSIRPDSPILSTASLR